RSHPVRTRVDDVTEYARPIAVYLRTRCSGDRLFIAAITAQEVQPVCRLRRVEHIKVRLFDLREAGPFERNALGPAPGKHRPGGLRRLTRRPGRRTRRTFGKTGQH